VTGKAMINPISKAMLMAPVDCAKYDVWAGFFFLSGVSSNFVLFPDLYS
jgi:hypothetical protein